jgi:polysaccharide pyruvyl transferase WcaK-like protein
MRILHVASFHGNIGDNANHNGLRNILSGLVGSDAEYTEMEMRRFYRNYSGADPLRFDEKFAEYANSFDLVVIGGGNFFEIWIEDSSTGCTIDMPSSTIEKLKTKVLFFGLGFDKYKGFTKSTEEKFFRFISQLQDKSRFLVTVRNDGSYEQFVDSYGIENGDLIKKVPDGGFFLEVDSSKGILLRPKSKNIVLSIAKDMPGVRFGGGNENTGLNQIIELFLNYLIGLEEKYENIHWILMPHIYSDLELISSLLERLPEAIRRSKVSVGPCYSGMGTERTFFANYKMADLVVGMRFHANVCPIGMGTPTIGINSYKKIYDLYKELGIDSKNFVNWNDPEGSGKLINLTEKLFREPDDMVEEIVNNGIYKLRTQFEDDFRHFFQS